jgi:hypothetical protein
MLLGVRNLEMRNYGMLDDNIEAYGFDRDSLRDSNSRFISSA